ncbi:hypothetical protein PLESTB_000916400 [Pleodorina starrii]|uniref:Uncharacterized protein n=1 Tax=Pleodorina starrii TaxID=330485 RepID=A0A9W6F405_9CHLO|nr:hypothetical protein PLESTM_001527400 [Pleodorina starrii]GLC54886.1 hypothetical protein PLESTB_000916400 [Pleodorina starrii]GLC73665.1 hypothetical protein PLESTF_001406100 [Pleodorina starrii]
MACPTLSQEQELHIQSAFLLTSAVDAFDPVLELKEKIELHNFTEYAMYEAGPLRAMLAISSNAIKFGANTKHNHMQINPTVFIAFSNSLRHPSHEVPGQTSMANFLAAQRACGFLGAAACHVHGHALAALESLPLGMVFSLLGQGYKLVATGFKFGGVVAHLFATRVLLQLHQEVQMARQMGINLTMTLSGNKVSSYAFGSPFFATSSLSRTLSAMDLQLHQQLNLHTIWRAGDASPAFFAAASELFTVASEARDAAYDITAADAAAAAAAAAAAGGGGDAAAGGGSAADDISSPASIARTPQVAAVQDWCRHVADGVDALSRCRASGPSRLLARPLETPLLARVCAPGGLVSPVPAASAAALDAGGDATAVVTDKVLQVRIADGDGGGGGGSGSSSAAGTPKSRATSAVSRPGPSRRRSQELLDTVAAAAAGRPLSPIRSLTGRSKRAVPVTAEGPTRSGRSSSSAVSPVVAARQQQLRQPAWRDALLRLLQVMGDGLGERYAPVGQFWILGSLPGSDKEKAAAAAAAAAAAQKDRPQSAGSLQPVEGPRATQSSAAWLSPGNGTCLFARWESELEEVQRDLMEAFPWVTFRTSVEVRGCNMERRDLLRPSPALDLGAM